MNFFLNITPLCLLLILTVLPEASFAQLTSRQERNLDAFANLYGYVRYFHPSDEASNINQARFPESLPNPVSMRQITGEVFPVTALAKELCRFVQLRYQVLQNQEAASILDQYNLLLYKRNEKVRFKTAAGLLETTIGEVNLDGSLITFDQMERRFEFGEVEWLL